ncbi:hypothetical protein [Paenibacillus qinlingensis]|uniref:hypothetical protein n=1 Tax=Paenibacillus qinlingensis TaxID=1837343 RepID=UPI001565DE12|nr:hypothetical protein [Paenibacillus qinlingensis]NQX61663.1 hypothetical protein [Paenibacillus qinlingensis]
MMNKPNFSYTKKAKWLASTLSMTCLLSGSTLVSSIAMAASSDAAVQPQTVVTTTYGTPDSLPTPPAPGLLPTPPAPGLLPTPPAPGLLAPPPGLPPIAIGLDRDAILAILNLSESQLREALESGQSLYEIATSQGVITQKLVDLAATALSEQLDRELKDGRISSEQYQSRLQEVNEHAEAILKRTHPKPPVPGADPKLPVGLVPALGPGLDQLNADTLLSFLGISSDKLSDELRNGQSLAEIAAVQGVDAQKLIDLVAQALTNQLDQELSEKMLWKDEYENRKQDISKRAADAIQHKHPQPPVPAQ